MQLGIFGLCSYKTSDTHLLQPWQIKILHCTIVHLLLFPLSFALYLLPRKNKYCALCFSALIIQWHSSLPELVSCTWSSIAGETDAKHQLLQFSKGTQPPCWIRWLHLVWPIYFSTTKKQSSPVFTLLFKHPSASSVPKLADAGKQAHIRLIHIWPQTQLGNCPAGVNTDTGKVSIQH